MRNLTLAPLSGIQNRLFANWLKLRDMNNVNDLIEKGFIKALEGRVIALHPMMQEVTMEETKPSVQKCRTLLDSLQHNMKPSVVSYNANHRGFFTSAIYQFI